MEAARGGDVTKARQLLKCEAADVNFSEGEMGYTPLILASDEGHWELVKLLLAQPMIEVNTSI